MGDRGDQNSTESRSAETNRFRITQAKGNFKEVSFDVVRSELAEAAGEEDIPFSLHVEDQDDIYAEGKENVWPVSAEHHWTIASGKGGFVVTETVNVSRFWLLPFISISIAICLMLWFLYSLDVLGAALLILLGFSFFLLGMSGIVLSSIPDYTVDTISKTLILQDSR